jgi:hypothetical protein
MFWSRPVKRGFWVATVAGTGVLLGYSWLLYTLVKRGAPVNLPAENEINILKASGTDRWERTGLPPVPDFTVPRKHIPIILKALNPAKQNDEDFPTRYDQVVAQLLITTTTGRICTITICDSGQNPICFTVDGIRCVRTGEYHPLDGENGMGADESMLFYLMLRGIYEEEVKREKSPELQHWIKYLKISRGESASSKPESDNGGDGKRVP